MKRYSISIIAVLLVGCGSGGSGPAHVSSAPGTGSGKVALQITGAKSFNPNTTPGKITQYVITVSGAGFDPIQTVVDGDATETTITGVPVGPGRLVHVAAYNPNSQMIREGEALDVTVPADAVAVAAIAMQAVPVIANVANGAYVPNTRLRFSIFSDPATVVELHSESNGSSGILTDIVENRPSVATSADTGLALFAPGSLTPGDYTLTVTDPKTGRHSQTSIKITDGKMERGAPFVSGAQRSGSSGMAFGNGLGMSPFLFVTQME